MYESDQYAQLEKAAIIGLSGSCRPTTRRERLLILKKELTQKLKECDEAIKALDAVPEMEAALNALEKVGIH